MAEGGAAAGSGNGRTGQQIPRSGDWKTIPVAAATVAAVTLACSTFVNGRDAATVDPASDYTVEKGRGARGGGVSFKKPLLRSESSSGRGGGGIFGNAWPARAEAARAGETSVDREDGRKSTMDG